MSHEGGKPVAVGQSTGRRKIVRRLAAVLGVDIRGYSTLMASNEEATHRRVGIAMARLVREIEKSYGRVFSFAGDGLMAEFPSAVEALKCALRVQADAFKRNMRLPREQHIEYRIGINSGEIVVQQERAGGTTINIAARLEQIGEPGGIFLSSVVFEQVSRVVITRYDLIGERRLKNIRQPIVVYRIAPETCQSWTGMPSLPRQTTPNTHAGGGDYRPSLAVLPLRTSPADMVDAYFADGMVDDIIRLLGGLKELLVISRSSTLEFARAPLDLRRIGHELDVRYVLHGSVRRSSDRLRIAVALSEAESGEMIWADRFEGEFSDLFELQDRIATRVATAIAPQLRERELGRAMRKHPATITAYDLTLQALAQIYRMDRESFRQAQKLLREAVAHDPSYAPAYSYSSYLQLLVIGQHWSQDLEADSALATAAAESAIRYDQNDAMALAVYGHLQSFVRRDYETAMTFLERAIVAGPSSAWAWSMNSLTCGYRGDGVSAVTRAENGVRLSPIGPDAFWHETALSLAHYVNCNYDAAIAWGRMSRAHNPNNGANLRLLIISLVAIGEREQAAQFVQELIAVAPTFRLHTLQTPFTGELRNSYIERLRTAGVPD